MKLLQEAVQADRDGTKAEEIDFLRKEINELLDEEEIRWNQRSIVDWLKLGIEIHNTFTTWLHKERGKMKSEGCGTKMGSGVKIWGR